MMRGSLTSYTHPATMDVKLLVLVTCLLVVLMGNQVAADFFYNPKSASTDQLEGLSLKCIPGRTVLKVKETLVPVVIDENPNSDENRRYGQTRRDHMRVVMKDESCSMCVCSTDGKHEYCSNRPAVNVNECLMMKKLMSRFEGSEPFDHERDLSFRIRRDYLWHNDEIPYDQKAACFRGHSYYTNSINANNTDIDVPDEIESLLDYTNKGICQFCVCSTDGREAGCISRNPWFCEYFRYIRTPGAIRDMYRNMFEQDRPAYFRHLSHRLRRTMDDGIYNFIDSGGDTLCCGHPNGHRRQIHNSVRNKLRIMKKKVPKENLLGGGPRGDYEDFIVNNDLGSDMDKKKCVPFVSQYTDCTDENICTGCTKCTCSAEGQWTCDSVQECDEEDQDDGDINERYIENALQTIESEMKTKRIKEAKATNTPLVPKPKKNFSKDLLLGYMIAVPHKRTEMHNIYI